MKLAAGKSELRGQVEIPGSKSHTIRCVALASLAKGQSEIFAPLVSADTGSAVRCYRALGAEIECGETWRVTGTGGEVKLPENVIDVGNSGVTVRFAMGSAALQDAGAAVFTGDHQIRERPVGPLLNSLNELGARCFSTRGNGRAPVVVQGKLRGGETSIEAVTSQYLSALLVCTPLAAKDSIINVTKLNEKPYVQITLDYLDELGIVYEHDNMEQFRVRGGQQFGGFNKRVPADFSSATFFLCAGAMLEGELTVNGLDMQDAQGDKAVVDILKEMGADIEVGAAAIVVRRGDLKGIEVDLNATPDALPALAVTACFAEGTTRLVNVPQARVKETDRIAVMAEELTKLGAKVKELPAGIEITPGRLQACELRGHDDHRVVMSLALAGLGLEGECVIDTAEAASVTFPDFVKLMQGVGANMRVIEDRA